MKQKGFFCLINKVYKKIKENTFTTNNAFWFSRNLRQPIQEIEPQKKVHVCFDSDEETVAWLQEHHSQYGWMYLPKEIETKEKEKHFFPTVRDGNKIIGYIKAGINKVYIMDYDEVIPLPKSVAIIYDTFILPEYRRLEISSFLVTKTMDMLRESGFKYLWCHIPPWNEASIGLYTKVGFKKVSHVRFIRLLRWKIFTRNLTKMILAKAE
jgi:ribosomal protein S18 acetylase RimI-like enzyme